MTELPTGLVQSGAPWITFEAREFIDKYCEAQGDRRLNVIEWGSGGSTIYFLRKGCNVVSFEHDPRWAAIVHTKAQEVFKEMDQPPRLTLHCEPLHGQDQGSCPYVLVSNLLYMDAAFDIALVDGRERSRVTTLASCIVRNGGLFIVDNTDRERERSAFNRSVNRNAEVHHFHGMGPQNKAPWTTSIAVYPRST